MGGWVGGSRRWVGGWVGDVCTCVAQRLLPEGADEDADDFRRVEDLYGKGRWMGGWVSRLMSRSNGFVGE